ncbi:alpha-N-acetylgalactosaminide alpha-2,6-sialyltransferase 2-like [Brachyhypopomus gauderio]|uniref:alpha-N-acetylgalactosaminide alpha-2,6-sialyltransferase 2-like n=1 Tax=Brachyhypopomus gauderio TaxID=698409 RepID=UPI004042EB6C
MDVFMDLTAVVFTLFAIIVGIIVLWKSSATVIRRNSAVNSTPPEYSLSSQAEVVTHCKEQENITADCLEAPHSGPGKLSVEWEATTQTTRDNLQSKSHQTIAGSQYEQGNVDPADCPIVQSMGGEDELPRYMPGMLRTSQLEKMMSREEMEEEQSAQQVYNSALKSRFLSGNGHGTTEEVTTRILPPPLNMSSRQNAISIAKEVLDTLHQDTTHHAENLTVLPLLYKTYFKEMPKWDFEDIYMQNNEERPVCSKSHIKDKEFQAAAIQNIQLWLHKGLLNISEWNRLAHFNNPFGFMEYNYTDVKTSVDLIPKPASYQLLPVPERADDGCIHCAVVGTSGILNGSKMGKEIDSHPYVFRVNGAIIKGHEEDVGNKTSVYVHTSFALHQSFLHLTKYGFRSPPMDEGIKYVMIPEGLRDFEWIQGLFKKKTLIKGIYIGSSPVHFYNGFKEDKFYVLHPDFLRYVRNRFLRSSTLDGDAWHVYRPTNGAFAIFLALHTCDVVNVYGFITEDHDRYSNYYYERSTKTKVIFYINHDYGLEMKTWKKLHESGIINLYQRNQSLSRTIT